MKKDTNKLDFWARGESGRWYHIREGTGDNLLREDIEEGYIDYIYYDIFDNLNDVNEDAEYDGGQIMLKEYYQDMTLEQILMAVAEMEEDTLEVVE